MYQLLSLLVVISARALMFPVFAAAPEGSLPVLVRDAQTHLPVAGAKVCIGEDTLCRVSDSSGTVVYSSIPTGKYTASVASPGYQPVTEWNVIVNKGLNYQLIVDVERADIVDLEKITVRGRKIVRSKPSQSTSVTRITNFELSQTAGTANDISRVLATNPAVVSTPGASDDNSLLVRGGGSNENVFVIDGIELDNANHFSDINGSGGAMSFLNGAVVRDLDFYTGGFPASQPPRLSSVIDMHLRTGSFTNYKMEAEANIAGFGFIAEGPLAKNISFLTNIRMVDLRPLDRFLELEGIPRFGDAMLKLVYVPNESNTVSAVGIGALDNYHEGYDTVDFRFPTSYDELIQQGGGIVDWNLHTGKMQNSLHFSGTARRVSRHDDAITTSDALKPDTFIANLTEYHRTNDIVDSMILPTDTMYFEVNRYSNRRLWENRDTRWGISVKDNFTLYLRERDQLSAGGIAAANRYRVFRNSAQHSNALFICPVDGGLHIEPYDSFKGYSNDSSIDIRHAGGFIEYVFDEGWVKAVAGLRGDYYTVLTDYGLSPRLALQLSPGTHFGTIAISGGLYYQLPSDFNGLVADLFAFGNSANTVVPLGEARLQRNWQGVVRYERPFGEQHNVTIETYYKWYDREYPLASPGYRTYSVVTDDTLHWLLDNPKGEKKAYGVELTFRKNSHDRFYYSGAYSLFNVENRYTDNKWYNDENNLGMMGNLTLGSDFARNHGISLRLSAYGGRPYSTIKKSDVYNSYAYDTTRGYYSERLPPIVSATVRYTFTVNCSWGGITGYLEIWNLFDQKPVLMRYLNTWSGYSDMTVNGLVPLLGVKVSF